MLNIICTRQAKLVAAKGRDGPTYIKFANVFEVLVKRLYHVVDELKEGELIDVVVDVNADNEIERRIATIDHLVLPML